MKMKNELRAVMAGALAFAASQLFIPTGNSGYKWFFNSGTAVVTTLGVVALAAILFELLERAFSPWSPLWLATGSSIAAVGYLMVIGPGNLWPIVMVMALGMLIPTGLIAGYIGKFIAPFVRRGD
jgi:hypothetical protein